MAERLDLLEVDGPGQRRLDAVSHGARAEPVLHFDAKGAGLRHLGLLGQFCDTLPGDPADLLADGLGCALPSPESELLPFGRQSAVVHVPVEILLPLSPSVALSGDHVELGEVGCGAQEATYPVQPAGVPHVEGLTPHKYVKPDVHRAPVLDRGCTQLSWCPGVPPDTGLRIACLGLVLPLPDEREHTVGEVLGDGSYGGSELVGLAAPSVVLGGGSEVDEVPEEGVCGGMLLDELEAVPGADVVHMGDGLVELQSGVHEEDGEVESRVDGEEEGCERVLPSGEGDDGGELVLGDGVLDEPGRLGDPLLDRRAVGLDDLVPSVGDVRGLVLLGLVPPGLHGHSLGFGDHLLAGHPCHPCGDDLPLGG